MSRQTTVIESNRHSTDSDNEPSHKYISTLFPNIYPWNVRILASAIVNYKDRSLNTSQEISNSISISNS